MKVDRAVLKRLPKVLLHEHLDGVLRPKTVIELARGVNYDQLPTEDPEELARWFHQGANQGSLPKYLEGFAHTIAVMQTEEGLERVAYEQAEDLSRDGVVYFETRFAPIFHTRKGLTPPASGLRRAEGTGARPKDFGIVVGIDHLRDAQHGCIARNGRTRRRLSRARSGGIRSGGRRRRLSSQKTCGRFSLYSAGEFQHYDSRRRRLWKGIDLAGDSILRSTPHRTRNTTDRRHRRRGWQGGEIGRPCPVRSG